MPPKRKGKERLAQEVLCKHTLPPTQFQSTTQNAGNFVFGALCGYANDRMVHSNPKCPLKQHRTQAICFGVFCGYANDRMAHSNPTCILKRHRTPANFCWCFRRLCQRPHGAFGSINAQIFILALFRSSADRMAHFYP